MVLRFQVILQRLASHREPTSNHHFGFGKSQGVPFNGIRLVNVFRFLRLKNCSQSSNLFRRKRKTERPQGQTLSPRGFAQWL